MNDEVVDAVDALLSGCRSGPGSGTDEYGPRKSEYQHYTPMRTSLAHCAAIACSYGKCIEGSVSCLQLAIVTML